MPLLIKKGLKSKMKQEEKNKILDGLVQEINKNYEEKGQALCSYKLRFDFPTDAGILNYLRGREFTVEHVDFVEKYFGD